MFSGLLSVFLCLFVCLCPVSIVYAQVAVIDLGQVVVEDKANGEDTAVEETVSIERKVLRTHKVVDVSEVLSDELIEASLIRKSGYGNEVGLRGFTKNNLRFQQDGALIEGSCGSRKDPPLSHINMLNVQSLEVREGPFDVTVPGSLGGNVNVITKEPLPGLHGELFSKFGSYGFLSQGGYLSGGSGILSALLGYNYSGAGQYRDGHGNKLHSFNSGYDDSGRNMDAFQKHDYWTKLLFSPSEKYQVKVSSSYGHANDIATPRVAMDTETEKTYLNRIEFFMRPHSQVSEELKISAYFNRVEHYPYGNFRTGPVANKRIESISSISGFQIRNMVFTDPAVLSYGADFYYRNWYGDVVDRRTGVMLNDQLFPDVDEINTGLFIKAEHDFEKMSVSAGLRGDFFHSEAQEQLVNSAVMTESNAQSDFLPGAYIFGKYYFSDNVTFFGGTGVTSRTPSAVERYTQQGGALFGNPDLKPSHNFETDLGMRFNVSEKFSFRIKGFYSFLDDFIYQTTVPSKTWTNIDAQIMGGDFNAEFALGKGFSLKGAMAYQYGCKLDHPVDNRDDDLAEISPLKTRLSFDYEGERLFAVFEWVYSADDDDIDSRAGERMLKGWNVFNLRAGYSFGSKEKDSLLNGLNLNAGINNIFDKKYAVANSYEYDPLNPGGSNVKVVNEPGRFFYTGISYRF